MATTKNVVCACGTVLRTKPEQAGRKVRCPKCDKLLTVPATPDVTHAESSSPGSALDVIRVTCECGKTLKATLKLAGKRVKCPACQRPLVVPVPQDPAAHGSELADQHRSVAPAQSEHFDPLASGGIDIGSIELEPPGTNVLGPVPQVRAAAAGSSARARTGKSAISLFDLAGWVAICFGGYQALFSITSLAWRLIYAVLGGHLLTILGLGTVLSALSLALGVWLLLSGVNMVRRVDSRKSLEHAAQASMVYIMLFILGLILSIIPLIALTGQSASLGLLALVLMISQVIYIAPPAFIIYVDSRRRRESSP